MKRIRTVMGAPLVALVRQQSVPGLISALGVLPVLNALVLGGLYQSLGGRGMDLVRFSTHWPYFVAVAAFVAGAASWEMELLSATRGHYRGRVMQALGSRAGYVVVAAGSIVALFLVLRIWVGSERLGAEALVMGGQLAGFAALGSGAALAWGFGSDKGVNNLVQVAPWVFALGPGPFLPSGLPVVGGLFPANGQVLDVRVELCRALAAFVVGMLLAHQALGPGRRPVFLGS